jgi:hypothetical protein
MPQVGGDTMVLIVHYYRWNRASKLEIAMGRYGHFSNYFHKTLVSEVW